MEHFNGPIWTTLHQDMLWYCLRKSHRVITGPLRTTKPATSCKTDEKSKARVTAWTLFKGPRKRTRSERRHTSLGELVTKGGTLRIRRWRKRVEGSRSLVAAFHQDPQSSSSKRVVTFIAGVYCFAVPCTDQVTGCVKPQMKGRFWWGAGEPWRSVGCGPLARFPCL